MEDESQVDNSIQNEDNDIPKEDELPFCASMEDVDHFFKNNYFMIEVKERHIDVENVENPL